MFKHCRLHSVALWCPIISKLQCPAASGCSANRASEAEYRMPQATTLEVPVEVPTGLLNSLVSALPSNARTREN